jgi:hypothetical protein
VFPYAIFPNCLLVCAIVVGPSRMLRATLWMLTEATISLLVAVALGLVAALVARPRTLPYLNQIVSRGLELTAALPMVLACGVMTVIAPIPIPVAIAVVIGILGGLRCIRIAASTAPTSTKLEGSPPSRFGHTLRRSVKRSLASVVPTVIEQIVGLEAAIAWLGLFDQAWTGGWGERLGQAARDGQLAHLATWTLATVGLSVGLKVLTWQGPDPLRRTSGGENAA